MDARATRRGPSTVDKQATIYAAEQNLKPWEVHTPPPAPHPRPHVLIQPPTRRVTQDERYHAAVAAPVSREARQKLADTMTPERKRQYDRTIAPPAPRRDTGIVHAVTSTPGSIAHNLATYLGVAGHVAAAPARSVARTAVETAYQAQQPGPIPGEVRAVAAGAKEPLYGAETLALGPDITKLSMGGHPSKLGLAVDVAALLPGTRITRLARAGIEAEIAARGLRGAEKAAAVEQAFTRAMEGQTLPGRVVSAARRSSTLRGPARVEAHRLIDEQVVDPLARKATKSQFDAHVYDAVKSLPARSRGDAASQIYHQLGDAMRNAPEHPVPGFRPVVDDVKAQANIRQAIKAHEIFPEVGIRARNAPEMSAENGVQVVGDISSPDYMSRLNVAVDGNAELGLRLASWYREAMPILRTFFGDDADAIMRGFAVSQANASPSGGLAAVLTVRDMMLRGQKIPKGAISTVLDSIKAAVQGEEISKGMAAKLHDFAASLEGRRTRSWAADDIRAGAPVAVDIHALRDVGLVDPKIIRTLRDRHGIDVSKLTIDNPQSAASGLQYELVAEKYRQLTQDMNDASFWGKDNWTPADVQALGWSAIQRIHGTFPEDLMFAVDRNTYEHAIEVLNGKTGMGRGLSYPAQMAVTQEVAKLLPRFVHDENAFLRDMTIGPAGWEGGTGVAVNMRIVGSPGQADRLAQRLAKAFDQYDVWAVRPNVSISSRPGAGAGRVAFEIRSEAFDSTDAVDKFWAALKRNTPQNLQKHLAGYMPFERDGLKGIRIITQSGPKPFARLPDYMEKNWETAVRKAAEEAGLTGRTRYNAVNVEVRNAADAGSRTRATYGGRLPRGSGGVGDPLAVEARAALTDAITRYSGVAGSARRGVAALASERGSLDLGAFFSRWAKPDIAREVIDPLPSREELLQASADEFRAWRQANPHADDSLVADLVKQIADHNGVDEYGLRTFIDTGRVPIGASESEDAMGEIRRIGRESSAVRRNQTRLQAQARAERIAAGQLEFERAGGGLAGHYASLAQLRGELPKLRFGNFEHFSDEAINGLFAHIEGHPDLRPYERLRARNAILRVLTGNVPQKNEVKLLGKVFGKDAAKSIVESVPFHAQLRRRALEIWNLPRALMATFDMSAPFRQGLVTSVRHPVLFGRNFKLMVRAFGSEKVYDGLMNEIVSMPRYKDMVRDGLSLTDLEHLDTREENLIGGQLAERIPIAGIPVRASGRAYTGFLNKMRADMYNLLADKAEEMGIDLGSKSRAKFAKGFTTPSKTESVGEALARYINSATGRGDIGILKDHAVTLNSLLFSPRLLASRINLFNPAYYTRLDPFARREAIRAFASMMGALSGVLYLAHMGGADVGLDPRSADFAKIKLGNTRIDILGGFQQPIRLLSQLFTGTIISSTTGDKINLASGKYGATTRMDVLQRFFRSKTAPFPSVFWDLMEGKNFIGDPITWQNEFLTHTMPLAGQDAYDMYTQTGTWPLIIGSYAGSGVGFGVQTYGPRPKKSRSTTMPPSTGLGGSLGGSLSGSLGGAP